MDTNGNQLILPMPQQNADGTWSIRFAPNANFNSSGTVTFAPPDTKIVEPTLRDIVQLFRHPEKEGALTFFQHSEIDQNEMRLIRESSSDEPIIPYVGSDNSEDRYGSIIDPRGWDTKNYMAGGEGVFLWAHDYKELPIGKTIKLSSERNRWVFNVRYAVDEYDFAATVYRLARGGYIKGVSIGFIPLDWESFEAKTVPSNIAENKRYTKVELLELSQVPVPANRNALKLALQDRAISENEVRNGLELLMTEEAPYIIMSRMLTKGREASEKREAAAPATTTTPAAPAVEAPAKPAAATRGEKLAALRAKFGKGNPPPKKGGASSQAANDVPPATGGDQNGQQQDQQQQDTPETVIGALADSLGAILDASDALDVDGQQALVEALYNVLDEVTSIENDLSQNAATTPDASNSDGSTPPPPPAKKKTYALVARSMARCEIGGGGCGDSGLTPYPKTDGETISPDDQAAELDAMRQMMSIYLNALGVAFTMWQVAEHDSLKWHAKNCVSNAMYGYDALVEYAQMWYGVDLEDGGDATVQASAEVVEQRSLLATVRATFKAEKVRKGAKLSKKDKDHLLKIKEQLDSFLADSGVDLAAGDEAPAAPTPVAPVVSNEAPAGAPKIDLTQFRSDLRMRVFGAGDDGATATEVKTVSSDSKGSASSEPPKQKRFSVLETIMNEVTK